MKTIQFVSILIFVFISGAQTIVLVDAIDAGRPLAIEIFFLVFMLSMAAINVFILLCGERHLS